MVEIASAGRRCARASTFAVLMSLTAVAGHALSGGMVPEPRVVAGTTAALFGAAWWLAARRRHWLVVAMAALAGQVGLHATYAVTMPSASRAHALSTIMCGTPHGHLMSGMAGAPRTGVPWSAGWMAVAHGVAAVVLVLVARYGEDVASWLGRLARAAVSVVIPACRAAVRPRALASTDVAAGPSDLLWSGGLRLRGPPALRV